MTKKNCTFYLNSCFYGKMVNLKKQVKLFPLCPPPPHPAPPQEFRHFSSLHPLILDFQTPPPNLKGEGGKKQWKPS